MKTITQITEEKQDKVLQSPLRAQIILKLKNAFAEEMLAYYQYLILEYFVGNNIDLGTDYKNLISEIAKDFKENAKDELEDHAFWILRRLKELGADWVGIENPMLLNDIADHKYIIPENTSLITCVEQVAEAEIGAIDTYEDLIAFTEGCDPVSNKKLKAILKDEQEHLKEMEEFKEKINKLYNTYDK